MNRGLVAGIGPGLNPTGRPEFDVLLVDGERDGLLFTGNDSRGRGYRVPVAADATRALRQLENRAGLPHDHRQVRTVPARGAACYGHKTFSIGAISEQDPSFAIENFQGQSRSLN